MTGTVYRSTGSWYEVKGTDGAFYSCRIKGKFRLQGIKSTNPVAVGDQVDFEIEKKGDEEIGIINEIHERDNYIVRKSVNLSKQTHIIAANVDQVFLLVTLNNPPTFTSFIDRFLVTAEAYHIPAVLVFNKVDTYDDSQDQVAIDPETGEEMLTMTELDEVRYLMSLYKSIGYDCIAISAATGKNVDQIKEKMTGKTSMFSGHSGAGKSTLANAVQPGLELKTKEISDQHKQGQHTTTFAEMFDLDFDARLIDTPGIKGFGVVDMEREEIGDYFPEIFELKSQCKFHNCLHIEEPKCAIKQAVEEGAIAASRYESYVQIVQGDEENYRQDKHVPK
ncbi:ribosome small subunit-dependent GTPase A [Nonlabens ponticola]|uniref:Small ribosomal subunit biogenesis GTPase RsgA n=1 Tax=Nonlabens ponticola TaxID=2496866 RepID=A0A3S9MWJ4_9FLAO|nr:ribosome small subunit-dependent GTPase A [Nonlabens ponticola]AZQ43568.1 ribosome small subunit-dependent GTPase A [Nonlabens ponticola]